MHLLLGSALLFVLSKAVRPASVHSDLCSIRQIPNGIIGKYVQEGTNRVYKEIPVGTESEDFEDLYLRCSDGFAVAGFLSQEELVWCYGGTWLREPVCVPRIYCEIPEKPEYGNMLLTPKARRPSAGTIAVFSCRGNKTASGRKTSTCLRTGKWTFPPPKCLDVSHCKSPAKTPGSRLILSPEKEIFTFGERLHFSCPAGMNLTSNSQVITCRKNGWSENVLPNCKDNALANKNESESGDVSCPRFPVSSDLEVTYSKNMLVGSVAKFSCLPSTRNLVGSPVSTCQENGSWSSRLPSCEGALGCVLNIDSSSHLLAHPVKDSYSFGEFVVLKCARGYLLTENVERMMCLGSTWSDSLPSCKPWRQRD